MTKKLQNPYSILLLGGILGFLNTAPAFIFVHLGLVSTSSLTFTILISLSALAMMLCVPLFFIKYIYKQEPSNFGFKFPDDKIKALKLTLVSILIITPILFVLSSVSNFQTYYYIGKISPIFIIEIIASFLYFLAEEFLFRGFLFFGLWERFGNKTYWITNLLFAILHFQKPFGEVFFAFLVGMWLSYLSKKTDSFVPALFVHSAMALILNIMIFLRF